MNEREKQQKFNEVITISGIPYARAKMGMEWEDSSSLRLSSRSHRRAVPERFAHESDSFEFLISYYGLAFLYTVILIAAALQFFSNYFYGTGMDNTLASLFLLTGSATAGFSLSRVTLKKLKRNGRNLFILH